MRTLVESTPEGLWCEAGGFHVDPWRPVERAVLTHAHGDHARAGSRSYLCAAPGLELARERTGAARIEGLRYGERIGVGDVTLSLHPAGHVLGSAQVRIEHASGTWVVSGDYKTAPDPTCEPLEPQRCDVFVTESTFGLPVYRWPDERELFDEVHRWWLASQREGRTAVLYAYALGKAQRVLARLDASLGPILVHGAVARFVAPYRAAGVRLAEHAHAGVEEAKATRGRALVVAPPSAAGPSWLRKFGATSEALASGWMRIRGARRRRALDRGFALSDHADWPGLVATIRATGAGRVLVTHGAVEPLVRWLREQGLDAAPLATEYQGEEEARAPAAGEADDGASVRGAGDDRTGDDGGAEHEAVGRGAASRQAADIQAGDGDADVDAADAADGDAAAGGP